MPEHFHEIPDWSFHVDEVSASVFSASGRNRAGKDGDVALYDGDPFEYTTHCIATVIGGKVVSSGKF